MTLREFLSFFIPARVPESFTTDYKDKFYSACIFSPERMISKLILISQTLASALSFISFVQTYSLIKSISPFIALLSSALTAVLLYLLSAYLISKGLLHLFLTLTLSSKSERIGRELYHVANIIYGLSRAGHPFMKTIDKIIDSDVHQDIKNEFMKIRNRVLFFGEDLRSAILNVAFTTPSPDLAQFLKGLVAYMDKSKDVSGYLSEYLTVENINRRLYLQAFNEKVNLIAGVYIYTMVILPILAITMAIMSLVYGTGDDSSVTVITYMVIPFTTLVVSLMILGESPEKEVERPYGNISQTLIAILLVTSIAPLYLYLIYPDIDLRVQGLVASLTVASAMAIIIAWQHHIENSIERETPSLLNYLLAASKVKESLSSAIVSTSKEKLGHIDKYIREVAVLSSTAVPIERALKNASKKVPTIFAKLMFTILSETAKSTKKTLDVLTGLINEYHRYVEYKRHRSKITSSISVTIIFSFVVILASLYLLETRYLGSMVSLVGSDVLLAAGTVTPADIGKIHDIFTAMSIIIGSLMPVGLTAINGDHRNFFKYFTITGSAVLAYLLIARMNIISL